MGRILPDQYFDHKADIGIIGRGKSIEQAFCHAAHAMFAIMGDLSEVNPKTQIDFEFTEEDIELAFVTFLNMLIAKSQSKNLLLAKFSLKKNNSHWKTQAWGEIWREDFTHGTEVKGATLTELNVFKANNLWEVRCVVDV